MIITDSSESGFGRIPEAGSPFGLSPGNSERIARDTGLKLVMPFQTGLDLAAVPFPQSR